MARQQRAISVQHKSFRHTINAQINRHTACPVNPDFTIGIAKPRQKPRAALGASL